MIRSDPSGMNAVINRNRLTSHENGSHSLDEQCVQSMRMQFLCLTLEVHGMVFRTVREGHMNDEPAIITSN